MQSLTTWPLSLQVILLLPDKNQFIIQHLTVLMIFCIKQQFKWKQGTFLVYLHDGIYIYRYTFSIFQYTFIGWVWRGPAAHLYQVMPEIPPPPGTTPLLEYMGAITEALGKGCGVDIIYLDFQETFDKVPHKRLLKQTVCIRYQRSNIKVD